MRLPEYRQTMGEFERQIGEKDLVIWGKNKACPELCARYGARYILDSNDELCDTKIGGIPVSLPEKIYGLEPSRTVVLLCRAESSTERLCVFWTKRVILPSFSGMFCRTRFWVSFPRRCMIIGSGSEGYRRFCGMTAPERYCRKWCAGESAD